MTIGDIIGLAARGDGRPGAAASMCIYLHCGPAPMMGSPDHRVTIT